MKELRSKVFDALAHSSNETSSDTLLTNVGTLLFGYNQVVTAKQLIPLDSNANPIPWMTFPAIDYLNNLNLAKSKVFEYGSGASTQYWSRVAASVVSIEKDELWYQKIRGKHLHNVQAFHETVPLKYAEHIARFDHKFDMIVVDGAYRLLCLKNCINHLADGGILILDNSDWYKKSCQFLRREKFSQIDFCGFGPINNYTWCTSMFFKGVIGIPRKGDDLEFPGQLLQEEFDEELSS